MYKDKKFKQILRLTINDELMLIVLLLVCFSKSSVCSLIVYGMTLIFWQWIGESIDFNQYDLVNHKIFANVLFFSPKKRYWTWRDQFEKKTFVFRKLSDCSSLLNDVKQKKETISTHSSCSSKLYHSTTLHLSTSLTWYFNCVKMNEISLIASKSRRINCSFVYFVFNLIYTTCCCPIWETSRRTRKGKYRVKSNLSIWCINRNKS